MSRSGNRGRKEPPHPHGRSSTSKRIGDCCTLAIERPIDGFAAGLKSAQDGELARAREARQLMLAADACLRIGADRPLLVLGFSEAHFTELRANAGTNGGCPANSLPNIRKTLRSLQREREFSVLAQ